MGVHTYSNPSHTHMCAHTNIEYTLICTVIYRYLHWTSNFLGLKIQSALFSHFEVFLFSHSADLPSFFYLFHFLSVQCHSQVPPALHTLGFFFFWSLQLWITLNFSQPSLSALLLHDTSQCNWHQLDLCKVLQPVMKRETGKLYDTMVESNFKCTLAVFIMLTNLFHSHTHTHIYMDGTHTYSQLLLKTLPPKWLKFIWLT